MKVTYMIAMMMFSIAASGQGQTPRVSVLQDNFTLNGPSDAPTSSEGREYRIGKDDLLEITVFEVPELTATTRVGASGAISMPLVGSLDVAGHTPREIEGKVEEALKTKYINDPHVTVFIREYASQPVSVIGAVKMPGIYQIKGQKSLLDMLAMAQGVDATAAGSTIQIMRRQTDSSVPPRAITISTEELFQYGKSDLNIPIEAGDVINVLQAGSIFVIGEVVRPGEFVLRQGKDITAAQAIALGSGFSREAKKQDCVIIRVHRDGTKEEIPVNVAKILDGSIDDVRLMPNDILFVPANKLKTGFMRVLDTTISTVSARLIYR